MTRTTFAVAALTLFASAPAFAEDARPWEAAEAGVLRDHVQLTFPDRFTRAGEAYFNSDASWIIFQATERPSDPDAAPSPHYAMYLAKLEKDASGDITGLSRIITLSEPGSANTCGWFDPRRPGFVLFGSTLVEPKEENQPGYQRGSGRYRWAFPVEMEIVEKYVPELDQDLRDRGVVPAETPIVGVETLDAVPMFERAGYDAECALDAEGKHLVYANVDPDVGTADLYIRNMLTGDEHHVVAAEGYDGGPFFSPDGSMLCYRSDRVGNNLLQLFVGVLKKDAEGNVTGLAREHQLTSNRHVNWAPYWHPSGRMLVYSTSEVSHRNYEVFAIDLPADIASREKIDASSITPRRITDAEGFDGLPVFSDDGDWMMWTSQRGPKFGDDQRPTSQIWIARVQPGLVKPN